jgi:hypothetical protein
MRRHRRDGAHYVEGAIAKGTESLGFSEPFELRLVPSALFGR